MNKKALLACMLVLTMMLSSCALVVTDPKVEAATPIVTVGDVVYTKAQVQAEVTNYLNYQASMQQQYYGQVLFNMNDEAVIASAQDEVVDMLVQEAVIDAKAKAMGLDKLTAEDEAKIEDDMKLYYDYVDAILGTPSDLADNAMAESYKQQLEQIRQQMTEEAIHNKLRDSVIADVTVTDEAVKAEYDTRVEAGKTSYAANIGAYANAVNNGTTVYYHPAGVRMAKNLLVQFNADDKTAMTSLTSKATTQKNAAASYLAQINTANGADVDAMIAPIVVTVTAKEDDATTLVAESNDPFGAPKDDEEKALNESLINYAIAKALAEKYDAMAAEATEKAYAAIAPKADEALAKLAAGEDWDAVMAEYTDDPGMKGTRETAKTGYAVTATGSSFDTKFVDAAMAIEQVGQWSDKVASDMYGYYIIQYTSDVQEGAVALENVAESIKAELLEDAQNKKYDETVKQWVTDAKPVIDKNALKK